MQTPEPASASPRICDANPPALDFSATRALWLEGWLRPGSPEAGHSTRLPVRGALGTLGRSLTLLGPANSELQQVSASIMWTV